MNYDLHSVSFSTAGSILVLRMPPPTKDRADSTGLYSVKDGRQLGEIGLQSKAAWVIVDKYVIGLNAPKLEREKTLEVLTEFVTVDISDPAKPIGSSSGFATANSPIISPVVDDRIFFRGGDGIYYYDLRAAVQ